MKVRFTGILKQAQTTSIFMFVVLGWIEYKMVFKLTNIDDPMERLKRAIVIVTEKIVDDERTQHMSTKGS
jgi:hypothetical protein